MAAGNSQLTVGIDADVTGLTKATTTASKAIDALQSDVKDLGNTNAEITVDTNAAGAQQSLDDLGSNVDKLNQTDVEITADVDTQRLDRDIANLKKVLDGIERRKAEPDVDLNLVGLLKDEAKVKKALDDLDHRKVEADADVHVNSTGLAQLQATVDDLGTAWGPLLSALGPLKDKVGGLGTVAGIAGAAFGGWKLTGLAGDVQTTQLQLGALTGSIESGTAAFKDLQSFAAATPFELDQVTTSARNLLAAGVAAGDLPDMLTDLGNVAAATGAPLDDISLIFQQMLSKGKVSNEELLQLAERGVPVFKALADQLGVTVAQAQNLAGAGKLGSDVITQLSTDLGALYPTAMSDQAESFNGQLSTFSDLIKQVGGNVGKLFLPSLTQLVGGLNAVLTPLLQVSSAIGDIPGPLKDILIAFGVASGLKKVLGPMFSGLAGGLGKFRAEISTTSGVASKLKGGLGAIAGAFNPWTIAITGGIAVLGLWAQKNADAKAKVDELSKGIDAQTGKLNEQGRAFVANKLADWVDDMDRAGVSISDVSDAVGDQDAYTRMIEHLHQIADANSEIVTTGGKGGGGTARVYNEQGDAANDLIRDLSGLHGTYDKSKKKADDAAEAARGVNDAFADTGGVDQLTSSLGKTNAQIKTLNEQIKTLLENYSTLRGDSLNIEEATVAISDAVAGVAGSVKENGTSLDQYTAKGAKNRLALGKIVEGTDQLVTAMVKEGKGHKQVAEARRQGNEQLRTTMRQAGFSKVAIRDFIREVQKTPRKQKVELSTVFNKQDIKTRDKEIKRLQGKSIEIKVKTSGGKLKVPTPEVKSMSVQDREKLKKAIRIDAKIRVAQGERDKLKNLKGDALIKAVWPDKNKGKVKGDLDEAANPGGEPRQAHYRAFVEPGIYERERRKLAEAANPGGKPRSAKYKSVTDEPSLKDVESKLGKLAKDRKATITVTINEVQGTKVKPKPTAKPTPRLAPVPNLSALRGVSPLLASPEAAPYFAPAAQAAAARNVQGSGSTITRTRLAPRQMPVQVLLDGAVIADHLHAKGQRMASVETVRRTA